MCQGRDRFAELRKNIPQVSWSNNPELPKRSKDCDSAQMKQNGENMLQALIFDCDGVLVDTERDGHRVAFNRAFAQKGLDIVWDVDLYKQLLRVGGGKERMRHYFEDQGWPAGVTDQDRFIKEMHTLKTDLFLQIIGAGELPLRSGISRIVDEAIEAGVRLAVCSTSNERSVNLIVETLLGPARKVRFAGIFAGDMASKKKPDPEIYNLAVRELDLDPAQCVVIEDSRNGLIAAKAAGFYCLVTTNGYTQDEDFSQADRVTDGLGDEAHVHIRLEDIRKMVAN